MPPWLQLMYDSFWRLFTAGLMFTLPLALLSFVGGRVVGFLVVLVRLYGPQL